MTMAATPKVASTIKGDEINGSRCTSTILTRPVPRAEFLGLVNRARATVFLPHQTEGFYIPALEGMGLETIVVCPDCVGNRSFCLADRNCLLPAFSTQAIRAAAEAAGRLTPADAELRLAVVKLLVQRRHRLDDIRYRDVGTRRHRLFRSTQCRLAVEIKLTLVQLGDIDETITERIQTHDMRLQRT